MDELVELILDKYDGSLKAEHGTGLNMAPFVEREWGAKATELMWRVKELADPDGVLAPGVVLNRDPGVHLRNLKTTPAIEEVATKCIECGFCEPVCPSRDLDHDAAPADRAAPRDGPPAGGLAGAARRCSSSTNTTAIETCAADGSCGLACPVGIDTGKLVKGLREREHAAARRARRAGRVAERWAAVERGRAGGPAGGARARRVGDARRLGCPAGGAR